jgi:hypothetical protein
MYFRRLIACGACGKVETMAVSYRMARLCRECKARRTLRQQRERRRLKAGLLVVQTKGQHTSLVPVQRPCQQCGRLFEPKRTTARYCSTRCRVYAYRRSL